MANFIVKVVCGKFTPEDDILAPGQYWTAINIYNLNHAASATLNVRIAVAEPAKPGGPFQAQGPSFNVPGQLLLKPEQALEIDCDYVMRAARDFAKHEKSFLKGFVVIRCDVALDVVAVYTSATPSGDAITLHTEHVASRRF